MNGAHDGAPPREPDSHPLAHELAQALAAILSNANAAVRLLTPPNDDVEQVREILVDIVENGRRAGTILKRIRDVLPKGDGVDGLA